MKKAKKRGNPKIAEAGAQTRFKPGVSPNPGGRPATASFSAAIREVAGLTVKELKTSKTDSIATAVAKSLVRSALKGKVSAISEAIDRSEGKARQSVDVKNQTPVQHTIVVEYESPKYPEPVAPSSDKPLPVFELLVDIVKTNPDERAVRLAGELALLLKNERSLTYGKP